MNLGENVALVCPFDLPISNDVHRLVACQCASCRIEGKEAQAGSGLALDETVNLLDEIIEVFDLGELMVNPIKHHVCCVMQISQPNESGTGYCPKMSKSGT